MGPKSQLDARFSNFTKKKMLSCPCFIEKRPFSKNKLLSCACFVMQTSILSKTLCSDVNFFHILNEKLLLSCPYLVQKNVNSAKTRLYFGPKKSKGCLFFRFFTKNKLFSCPYIAKNNVHSLKTRCFHAHIFQKYVHYLKNTVLSCHFFQFFQENPPSVMPIFVPKNVNSVKITLYYGLKTSIGYSFFPIFQEKITVFIPYFVNRTSIL